MDKPKGVSLLLDPSDSQMWHRSLLTCLLASDTWWCGFCTNISFCITLYFWSTPFLACFSFASPSLAPSLQEKQWGREMDTEFYIVSGSFPFPSSIPNCEHNVWSSDISSKHRVSQELMSKWHLWALFGSIAKVLWLYTTSGRKLCRLSQVMRSRT